MQFFISVLYEIMSYSKMSTTSSCILVSLWLYLCTPFISVVMYKYGLQKKSEQPIACMDQLVIFLSQFLGRFINSVCKGNEGRTIQISVFFHVPKRKNKQNTEDRRQERFSFRSLKQKVGRIDKQPPILRVIFLSSHAPLITSAEIRSLYSCHSL